VLVVTLPSRTALRTALHSRRAKTSAGALEFEPRVAEVKATDQISTGWNEDDGSS
jgi:hypothetical protein